MAGTGIAARDWSHDADAALVGATQRGDLEAFGELFRRHYPSVRRACTRRLCDPAEAEDVVQAAFVRAFERIDRCAGDRRFGGWVNVIARNMCADVLRSRSRSLRTREWFEGLEPPDVEDPVGAGPEEIVLVAERARHLKVALAALPDRQRGAFLARVVENRGPTEIAVRLGVSTGAVDSLLLRARRQLVQAYWY